MVAARRFDVVLVDLEPTQGSEVRRTRPCLVISPDELNEGLQTMIVAPMTTQTRAYPWRVQVVIEGRAGRIALDQIRTVDRARAVRRLGHLDQRAEQAVLDTLAELFAP